MKKNNYTKVTAYAFGPSIFSNDGGSLNVDIVLRDEKIIQRIIKGTRGLSPEYKIKWYQCMICQQDYENCPHEDGKEYDGIICILAPRGLEFIAQSIVDKPEDPRARIIDMLLIDKTKNKTEYTWYGFETDSEKRRFKNIQEASDKKLIPEKVALKFVDYFTNNYTGNCTYTK